MGGGGGFINKVLKKTVGAEKLFGTNKLTGGILDQYLGTDILGKKEQAEREATEQRDANQRALNAQNNANILDVNAQAENVVQTQAGGSADMAAASDTKRKRTGSIAATLGF